LRFKIHKLINFIRNKKELLEQWKEFIIVPVHRNGDKTDCSTYRGISLLSTSYKTVSNILHSRLNVYGRSTRALPRDLKQRYLGGLRTAPDRQKKKFIYR
jgi:hypothetical protein